MTSGEKITQALGRVPLFHNVPEPYVGEIAERIRMRHYPPGEIIFHQHDAGEGLYLVARGRVRAFIRSEQGNELTLAYFNPGEFFGELAVIDEEERSATTVAAEACDLLILQRTDFLAYLRTRPEAAIFCLRILARRLRDTDAHLEDATFMTLPGRLAKTLLELGESYGTRAADGCISISMRLNQSELASIVGGSRPTVNQLLQRFRRLGWIRLERGQMIIVKDERLRRIVQ